MAERYRDAYPSNVRWERPSNIELHREYDDEAILTPISDEQWRAMERGEAECRWCGKPALESHPAGIASNKWRCAGCGRFQNENYDEASW